MVQELPELHTNTQSILSDNSWNLPVWDATAQDLSHESDKEPHLPDRDSTLHKSFWGL